MIFAELVLKLPRFASREMYSRRKEELWAEDIYVFAFSAVSGLPDKRLDKGLKPMLDLDATHTSVLEDDVQDNHDTQTMIELCIQLTDKVRELEAVIQVQDARLKVLENSSTKSKIAMLHERNKNRSRDQAEEREPGAASSR